MCGENIHIYEANLAMAGSPPHVRGKLDIVNADIAKRGITPACAGKTRNFQEGLCRL